MKFLIALLMFAFITAGCELVKGNDDRMHGIWKILDGSWGEKIIIDTDDKIISYYNSFNDPKDKYYDQGPYRFRSNRLIIRGIAWLDDGDYNVYFSGKYMYWYLYDERYGFYYYNTTFVRP